MSNKGFGSIYSVQMVNRNKYWSIWLVVMLTPLFIWATIPILPTFDDWTSLISPSFEPLFSKERFLFYGYHWRPFDSVFGWIVGRNPHFLFPMLNHIFVVLGHAVCTLIVYRLTTILRLNILARNIATIFFFITPAMLATTLAVDGLNQTYANLWGMTALTIYLEIKGAKKYVLWIMAVVIATLCKENGLMWIIISPLFAFGFDFINKTEFRKDIIIGCSVIFIYALAIVLLPSDIEIHPEYIPSIEKVIKDIFKFLLTTFVCVDFVSLLHEPSRNWGVVLFTLALSTPFFYYVFIRKIKLFLSKKMVFLILCLFIAVAPHLFTVYSMMHTYAGLGIVAVMVGYIINTYKKTKLLKWSFALFVLSASFIDIHLWSESLKSGLMSKELSKEIILKTGVPVNKVALIIIEDDYPKLSSFCVVPSDALGWGIAVQHENNYQWPTMINDTLIERRPDADRIAEEMALRKVKSKEVDCVWIINHKNIKVIKQ